MSWAQNTSVIKQTSSSYMLKQAHKIMHNSTEATQGQPQNHLVTDILSRTSTRARTHTHTRPSIRAELIISQGIDQTVPNRNTCTTSKTENLRVIDFTLPKKLLKSKRTHNLKSVFVCVCRDLILVRQWSHTNEWISQDHAGYKLLLEIRFENKHEFIDKTTIS